MLYRKGAKTSVPSDKEICYTCLPKPTCPKLKCFCSQLGSKDSHNINIQLTTLYF